jgi:DNA-binding response OmpR family regulator
MQSTRDGGLVLIVEDNRNISEMVGEYLEGRGFEVDFAADGLDGYRLSTENSYDVIVLDLMLPRMDGIEVCKKLREEARKSTPVLMLTARDTLDEKLNGLSVGADDYLTKPFAIQELEARLRALIRRERRQVGGEVLKVAHRAAAVADRPAPTHDPDARIAAGGQSAGNRTRNMG